MRARSFSYGLLFALSSLAVACSGSSAETNRGTSPVGADAGAIPAQNEDAAAESETCAAERAALQVKLDAAHHATTGAVLALKTPACGVRILTSAPEKLALTPEKLQRVGSITKTYVAGVILSLAHEGALGLDDTLAKHLPDTGLLHADVITVRNLLNHTSGVANYTDTKAFADVERGAARKVAPAELVQMATTGTPYFAPGEGWHYSNTNFVLLGMIVEKVTGQPLAAVIRARVLEKVALKETFLDGDETVSGAVATGLDSRGNDLTSKYNMSLAWAAGAMVASPRDVLTWIEALGAGTFHDAATQKEMTTPAKTDNRNLDYGLGVFLFHANITGMGPGIGHGGDIPGYHSEAVYLPDAKTTLFGVVDSDRDNANDVIVGALEVLAPR